jgi:hypothetical protein
MPPRGTRIEGWWAWFPVSGGVHARVFTSEEDARTYVPTVNSKAYKDRSPVLGPKYIMRVVWDYDNNRWSSDPIITQTQDEVWDEFYRQGDAV